MDAVAATDTPCAVGAVEMPSVFRTEFMVRVRVRVAICVAGDLQCLDGIDG
jgi:hypothetical protein